MRSLLFVLADGGSKLDKALLSSAGPNDAIQRRSDVIL